jgi:membrane-associated phospholipid phosphatase
MAMAIAQPTQQLSSPRWPTRRAWLLFAAQAVIVVMADALNDVFRGNIQPPNAAEAVHHARQIASFEAAHGFFVEPAWQTFFRHIRSLLGIPLNWADVVQFANSVYGFCHIFVTLLVAVWIFARHRDRFPFVRNVMLITNALAFVAYEVYPVAPPRLTSGLIFNHHVFRFQDTMQHVIGSGKLNGVPIGYNAYSAMPSVHAAWALVIGLSVIWLARNPLLRIFGALYPGVMVFTIVVTGNHYLMDAIGGALAVMVAVLIALGIERIRRTLSSHGKRRPGIHLSRAHLSNRLSSRME